MLCMKNGIKRYISLAFIMLSLLVLAFVMGNTNFVKVSRLEQIMGYIKETRIKNAQYSITFGENLIPNDVIHNGLVSIEDFCDITNDEYRYSYDTESVKVWHDDFWFTYLFGSNYVMDQDG